MRLIDADALLQHTYSAIIDGVETDIIDASNIDNAPTVEDVSNQEAYEMYNKGYMSGYEMAKKKTERPQGKWVVSEDSIFGNFKKCSNCNEEAVWLDGGSQLLSNFCPNCGAEMKGGAE